MTDEDDHDPAQVTVTQTFDLAIQKTIDPDASPYEKGDTVSFKIEVYNQGTLDATGVEVMEYLPTGMNYVSGDFTTTAPHTAVIASLPK